jgi:Predicted dehydrogenases and related proteins
MITVAVVGVGGWGKNLARNYYEIPDCRLKYICDLDSTKLSAIAARLPGTLPISDFSIVLQDPEVQAVIIATPGPTHYALCRQALEHGKDVYVEKPFVLEVAHAEELIDLAARRERVLMVGHLLEYHPVVNYLRNLIHTNELGDIYYIYTQRLNLGTVRKDENALWNFAPHDISSILYLLNREPTDVSARGQCYLQRGVEDVVFMTLNFADKSMAHVHVSWLDPHKVRKIIIVGSRKMAVFDDVEGTEKLRIYDKGAAQNTDYNSFAEYVSLRFGDVVMPYVKVAEPLRLESQHFLDCIRTRQCPRSDGYDGLRVARVLDAAQRSLRQNGQPVRIQTDELRVPAIA